MLLACCLPRCLFFIKINSNKIADNVGEIVIGRGAQSVNGKLSVGGVDISLFGATVIRNLVLTDLNGEVILTSDMVSVDYGLSDLLSNNLNLESIKSVTVSGLKLNLVQDRSGVSGIFDRILKSN